jgi:hypothetical protein
MSYMGGLSNRKEADKSKYEQQTKKTTTTTKKKKNHDNPLHRSRWEWGRHMKEKKANVAATMIQRKFRNYLEHCKFIETRYRVRTTMNRMKRHRTLFNREFWQSVNLYDLKRSELDDLAMRLELPGTYGKKDKIIKTIQRWMDLRMHVHDVALEAAAKAAEKKLEAQGSVYVLDASPGSEPYMIRPLSGRNISVVASVR